MGRLSLAVTEMAAAALGKVQTGRGAAWVLSPCCDQQGCACSDGAILGHSPLQGMGEVSPINEPQRPRMVEKCLLGAFTERRGRGAGQTKAVDGQSGDRTGFQASSA